MKVIDLIYVIIFLCILLGICNGLLLFVSGASILQALTGALFVIVAVGSFTVIPVLIIYWLSLL